MALTRNGVALTAAQQSDVCASIGAAPSKKTMLSSAAMSASAGNLVKNASNSGLATVSVSTTAPSFTGFTNLIPATGRFAAAHTFNTTAGSKVLTNYSYVSGSGLSSLAVGMPLCQRTTGAYPDAIPPGAVIESIDTVNNTVTMSKTATATSTSISVGFWPRGVRLVGGVLGSAGGSSEARVVMGTVGNSVTPPTAQNNNIVGHVFEFYTDAGNFSTSAATIIASVYAGGATLQKYRVAVDDVYLTSDAVDLAGANTTNHISIQLATAGAHKIRLEFQDGAVLTALYITSSAQVWNSDAKPKALMFGDSYFLGGASGSFIPNNLAHMICQILGWECYTAAVGGTGYYSDGGSNYAWSNPLRYRDFGIIAPDVIVLFGSLNDGSATAAQVKSAAKTTWAAARAANPLAPIVIIGIPATNTATNGYPNQEQGLIDGFVEWADPNSWFFPITLDKDGIWLTSGNRPSYIAADNAHPSYTGLASGNRYLAQRISEKIRTFVLPNN